MRAWMGKVFLCVLGLFATDASATLQQRDTIAIDGRVAELRVYPLAPWLARHPEALPRDVLSTNRMRGYAAHWMLVDGRLELARVDVTFSGPTKSGRALQVVDLETGEWKEVTSEMPSFVERDVLATLFPTRNRVVADWYSGTLVVEHGAPTDLVGFADSTLYERYTLVVIEHGYERARLRLDARQYDSYRLARFRRFQQMPAYEDAMRELASYGWDQADAVSAVYGDRLQEYISLDAPDR